MVKRALYDLSNEEFALFVDVLGKSFDQEQIDYIYVGGTAVQLHLANLLCKKEGIGLEKLAEDHILQDFLRPTDDVDIALASSVYLDDERQNEVAYLRRINAVLTPITVQTHLSPSGNRLVEYRFARKGAKRPILNVFVDEEWSDGERIMMNISRKPEDLEKLESKFYDRFVELGERVSVPYNAPFTINARVIPITQLLATKASNFRAKDAMDIQNLVELMRGVEVPVDYATIEATLGPENLRNYHKFLTLVGEH